MTLAGAATVSSISIDSRVCRGRRAIVVVFGYIRYIAVSLNGSVNNICHQGSCDNRFHLVNDDGFDVKNQM